MGILGGARVIKCPAGEWTSLISNFGSGIPARFTITFEPVEGGKLGGSFRERRYFWIFPQAPREGPLAPRMIFDRYWINAIYKVEVFPRESGLVATIEGGVFG